MLKSCNKILLISEDESLIQKYETLAPMCNVELTVRREWNIKFRTPHELIIADGKMIDTVAYEYRSKTIMVLNKNERFFDAKSKADRFVFDRDNLQELMYSFCAVTVPTPLKDIKSLASIIHDANCGVYKRGEYDFDFSNDLYSYRGKRIYLTNQQRISLAKWLLLGVREKVDYTHLCHLRKKFGDAFMRGVNKYGEIR